MDSHSLVAWLIIGAIAGWLAGAFVRGGGFGLLGDIVVGIIGAFIGGWPAGVLHIHVGTGWISTIITAALGAVVLLVILRLSDEPRASNPCSAAPRGSRPDPGTSGPRGPSRG